MRHIMLFSGGVASYIAAKRVIAEYGKDDVILLFTDTRIEDYDLYRFLDETEAKLGIQITRLAEGRTIWQVFKDVKFLGNSRIDPCSRVLKRELARNFVSSFWPPETIIYLGYNWDEYHRLKNARRFWSPYGAKAPLCDPPYISKEDMFAECEADGIRIPRLYTFGLPHNNCGGGCVKAGIGHFVMLLEQLPDVYAVWEQKEQEIRDHIGKDVSILVRTRDGEKKPFTLKQLREEKETLSRFERDEIGGCGCFAPTEDEMGIFPMLFGNLFQVSAQ